MTPTGQPALDTAGREHPISMLLLTVVSGPDTWTIYCGRPLLARAVGFGDGDRA
jgi:hypothetical protein